MNFSSTFFILLLILKVYFGDCCPDGCHCEEKGIRCDGLSAMELSQMLSSLTNLPLANIETFSIKSTPNFTLNKFPSLPLLKTLIIDNCTNSDEWILERGQFPNVTLMRYVNSKLATFSKYFMVSFPKLIELDLSGNGMESLGHDSFHLARLQKFNLRDNNIQLLGVHILRYMPELQELDLTGNKMQRLVTSDFYSASSLRSLKLSNNRIRVIECDTSTPLPQIELLDLSGNNFTDIPGEGIRNMERLVTLNISRNPIRIIGEGSIRLPNLQILDVSKCNLSVVEAGAFTYLPHLHTLYLNDNSRLISISPFATNEKSALFSLDLRNTGFTKLPYNIFRQISRIYLAGIRLDCACAAHDLSRVDGITIVDWAEVMCVTKTGAVYRMSEINEAKMTSRDSCRDRLALPFGDEQIATVGDTFKVHCSSDNQGAKVTWKTPAGKIEEAGHPELITAFKKQDYFTTSLLDPASSKNQLNRTHPTTDFYGIDVVLEKDTGVYECIAKSDDQTQSRKISLKVVKPDIQINASHTGITTVHLTWNKNLQVQAVDRIALQFVIESGSDFRREVQLSLYNMYCSYNLINLQPDREYKICLQWVITYDMTVIYSTCLTERTQAVKTLYDSMSLEFILILTIILLAVCCFCCCNCIQQRFNFLAQAKRESKMQQSVSGQSMLSSSVSSSADATMYENFQLHTSPSFHA
ncbi:unnamed protein product [Caenorhabditis angaria]|uniref:Ig-like domain-containing protein n=1 Tax=Caenorhabditis angaria TaxID=860376 RepID=A0A9P1NA84_9PELO|nr:unnamed protein product [Caenorhabditis angaria]